MVEVAVRLVLGPLAQAERAPVQRHARLAGQPGHEQLHHDGQHRQRPAAAVRRVVRHVPPAQDGQPLVGGQPLDDRFRGRPLPVIGQEDQASRVAALGREVKFTYGTEELIRDLRHDPGAVAGIRVTALGPAVLQVAQHRQRARHGVMTAVAGQVGHEPDAAGIVLVAAVIQPLAGRVPNRDVSTCH
jgi:hypothetical protein